MKFSNVPGRNSTFLMPMRFAISRATSTS